MSHHIYKTEAMVLGGFSFGERNRSVYLLTEDLGIVIGSAQGVRDIKSKLRYSLQDYSLSEVALVHGKSGWKITSAAFKKNYYDVFKDNKIKLSICAHTVALLRRLIAGEESNKKLYGICISAFEFMESKDFSDEQLKALENVLVMRVIDNLGYLKDKTNLRDIISSEGWNENVLSVAALHKNEAIREINHALKESQL